MVNESYRYHCSLAVAIIFSVAWTFLSLPEALSQESPAYLGFVSNAADFPVEEYFDYIIVGGGTAGCPLAATLSEKFRVLVLERGGIPYGNQNVGSQEGFLSTLRDTDRFTSPAQAFTSLDGVPNSRGRILGGSSAINAGFYSRADDEFYEASRINWGDLSSVNHSYEWVEKAIVFKPRLRRWQSTLRDGLLEAGINPYNGFTLDHKTGTKIGGSTFDSSGRRHSAADLLSYANPSNIDIVVEANVERVLLGTASSPAAVGVVFRDRMRRFHHALLRNKGEVLLCAGSIGSPQLLLLSGIGSRSYLASWGIPVAHHLPYVGRFLYDNPRNGITIIPPVPIEHSLIQVVGITNSGAYLEGASNVVPFSVPSTVFITVATLMQKIIGPYSYGSLRLASTDVRENPLVTFNYFRHPRDLERCINGTRLMIAVLNTNAMRDMKFRLLSGDTSFRFIGHGLPPEGASDAAVGEFCRRTVSSIWHYHGGCLVDKVVDSDLKVMGIDRLRVVDGSTFTVSPGTNPQATLLMLGRFFGLKIMKERAAD